MTTSEVGPLLTRWANGSLDSLIDTGHVVLGVQGCVLSGKQFKAQTLVHQFTSDEVEQVLADLASATSTHTYALVLVFRYLYGWTSDRLARVLQCTVPKMDNFLMKAKDVFLKQLLQIGIEEA